MSRYTKSWGSPNRRSALPIPQADLRGMIAALG